MVLPFRLALLALFLGLTLTACGRTVQEEVSESVTEAAEEEAAEDINVDEEGEFSYLTDLMYTFRQSANQDELEAAIAAGRAEGYSDEDIASAMGLAHLLTPGRRVLISVAFVRFKNESEVPSAQLTEAYDYASTPPWLRDPEEEESAEEDSEEDEADEEEPPRRRNGWFSWIPGL